MADSKLLHLFEAEKTIPSVNVPPRDIPSVLATTGKPQLVLWFKHFAKQKVVVSEDFNANSVHHTLLTFDHIC